MSFIWQIQTSAWDMHPLLKILDFVPALGIEHRSLESKTMLCKVIHFGRHIRKDKGGWLRDNSVRKMTCHVAWHGIKYVTACCGVVWMVCAVLCCALTWQSMQYGALGHAVVCCVRVLWVWHSVTEKSQALEDLAFHLSIKLLTFNKSLNSQEICFLTCKRKITTTNI